jgi:hypothetical protein
MYTRFRPYPHLLPCALSPFAIRLLKLDAQYSAFLAPDAPLFTPWVIMSIFRVMSGFGSSTNGKAKKAIGVICGSGGIWSV